MTETDWSAGSIDPALFRNRSFASPARMHCNQRALASWLSSLRPCETPICSDIAFQLRESIWKANASANATTIHSAHSITKSRMAVIRLLWVDWQAERRRALGPRGWLGRFSSLRPVLEGGRACGGVFVDYSSTTAPEVISVKARRRAASSCFTTLNLFDGNTMTARVRSARFCW